MLAQNNGSLAVGGDAPRLRRRFPHVWAAQPHGQHKREALACSQPRSLRKRAARRTAHGTTDGGSADSCSVLLLLVSLLVPLAPASLAAARSAAVVFRRLASLALRRHAGRCAQGAGH
jgi:hypothetical protein